MNGSFHLPCGVGKGFFSSVSTCLSLPFWNTSTSENGAVRFSSSMAFKAKTSTKCQNKFRTYKEGSIQRQIEVKLKQLVHLLRQNNAAIKYNLSKNYKNYKYLFFTFVRLFSSVQLHEAKRVMNLFAPSSPTPRCAGKISHAYGRGTDELF